MSQKSRVMKRKQAARRRQQSVSRDRRSDKAAQAEQDGLRAYQSGDVNAAVRLMRRAIELDPQEARLWNNLAGVLLVCNQLVEAESSLERAVSLKPDYPDAWCNLGNVSDRLGKSDAAKASYLQALKLRPRYPDALNNLGIVLAGEGQYDDARSCYESALRLQPDHGDAHCNLGKLYRDTYDYDQARYYFQKAIELGRANSNVYCGLAQLESSIGDRERSLMYCRKAIQVNPRDTKAHYRLADMLAAELPVSDFAAMQTLLSDPLLSDNDRGALHFAIAGVLDARSDYTSAAEHYREGNACKLRHRELLGHFYKPEMMTSMVDRIISHCDADYFSRVAGWGADTQLPVFIVGLPRSGTTLTEQILASHPNVHGAGELSYIQKDLVSVSKSLGLSGLAMADSYGQLTESLIRPLAESRLEAYAAFDPSAIRVVDKMPDNFLKLGLIYAMFPNSRIVHCRRNLRDTAVSCWCTMFSTVHWSFDQKHIVSYFENYQRLMAHWRAVFPGRMYELDYERLVESTESESRRLFDFLGLEWDDACKSFHKSTRPVTTASYQQVRRPIYQSSINRWQRYGDSVKTMIESLTV